jgi:hypothetical protein
MISLWRGTALVLRLAGFQSARFIRREWRQPLARPGGPRPLGERAHGLPGGRPEWPPLDLSGPAREFAPERCSPATPRQTRSTTHRPVRTRRCTRFSMCVIVARLRDAGVWPAPSRRRLVRTTPRISGEGRAALPSQTSCAAFPDQRPARPVARAGYRVPVGAEKVLPRVRGLIEDAEAGLPGALRAVLPRPATRSRRSARASSSPSGIEALAEQTPVVAWPCSSPGIGLLSATALVAFVGDVQRFATGRHFAELPGPDAPRVLERPLAGADLTFLLTEESRCACSTPPSPVSGSRTRHVRQIKAVVAGYAPTRRSSQPVVLPRRYTCDRRPGS